MAALLGGTFALALGKAAGWIDDDGRVETVLVPTPAEPTPRAESGETDAAKPLVGNGFDAAELYRKRCRGRHHLRALPGERRRRCVCLTGSGFVVSEDGYILTNSHVVTTAGESGARLPRRGGHGLRPVPRRGHPAAIVGWDLFDDGPLKVDPADHAVSPVPLGDSGTVVVGEPVAAIGSPFGQESSLSVGVISATERSIESITSDFNLVDAIQTDAPINRGNSGGPMFNAEGEVIGINAQIRSESGTAEGVGFAIPINSARRSMEQLIQTGEVRYAWLGVTTQTVTPRIAERFGFAESRGAAVQSVAGGKPRRSGRSRRRRRRAGGRRPPLRRRSHCGDRRRSVRSAEDVVRAVNQQRLPGDEIRLTVLRGTRSGSSSSRRSASGRRARRGSTARPSSRGPRLVGVLPSEDLILLGDNLDVLPRFDDGCFQLVYADPPFNTGRGSGASPWRPRRVRRRPDGSAARRYATRVLGESSFADDFDDYLGFLEPRLRELRRLLAPTGTLYLHPTTARRTTRRCFSTVCSVATASSTRSSGRTTTVRPRRRWPAKHDTILVYVSRPERYWFDAEAVEREPYMAPGLVTEKAAGKLPTDVWWHTIVSPTGSEKTGYPTQKPEGVVRRIVQASSRPGDWCLDPFAGSGTLAKVVRSLVAATSSSTRARRPSRLPANAWEALDFTATGRVGGDFAREERERHFSERGLACHPGQGRVHRPGRLAVTGLLRPRAVEPEVIADVKLA